VLLLSVDDRGEPEGAADSSGDVFVLTHHGGVHLGPVAPKRLAEMPDDSRCCASEDDNHDDGDPGLPHHASVEIVDVPRGGVPERFASGGQLDARREKDGAHIPPTCGAPFRRSYGEHTQHGPDPTWGRASAGLPAE